MVCLGSQGCIAASSLPIGRVDSLIPDLALSLRLESYGKSNKGRGPAGSALIGACPVRPTNALPYDTRRSFLPSPTINTRTKEPRRFPQRLPVDLWSHFRSLLIWDFITRSGVSNSREIIPGNVAGATITLCTVHTPVDRKAVRCNVDLLRPYSRSQVAGTVWVRQTGTSHAGCNNQSYCREGIGPRTGARSSEGRTPSVSFLGMFFCLLFSIVRSRPWKLT